jgi:hypothetical protein
MRGAVCERIVLERGSILSARAGGGPAVLVQVTDLRVGENGEIYADLARQGTPGVRAARGPWLQQPPEGTASIAPCPPPRLAPGTNGDAIRDLTWPSLCYLPRHIGIYTRIPAEDRPDFGSWISALWPSLMRAADVSTL